MELGPPAAWPTTSTRRAPSSQAIEGSPSANVYRRFRRFVLYCGASPAVLSSSGQLPPIAVLLRSFFSSFRLARLARSLLFPRVASLAAGGAFWTLSSHRALSFLPFFLPFFLGFGSVLPFGFLSLARQFPQYCLEHPRGKRLVVPAACVDGLLGALDGAIFPSPYSFPLSLLIFLFCRGLGLGTLPPAVLDWGLACPDFARVPAWALGPPRRLILFVQVPVRLGATRGVTLRRPRSVWFVLPLSSMVLVVCWALVFLLPPFSFFSFCSALAVPFLFFAPSLLRLFVLPIFFRLSVLLSAERRLICGTL